ncbi:MAG: TldD/PmbA family protein [Dehalococcoidales bacterium]|nr:TldD/PmbA family protein [Dehalococcoidales bacterium]
MADIDAIGQELANSLSKYEADYLEAHLEESRNNQITYRGKKLESVDKSTAIGGNVRALVKGGWGFVCFNSLDELPERLARAVEQARFVGGEKSNLAEVEPVVEKVPAEDGKNPLTIPLVEKKQLLDEYNDIIWSTPGIQTSVISYGDGARKTIFLNSRGSYIEQERRDVTLRLTAVAARDGEVQQAGLSLGSRGDFSAIQHLNSKVEEMAQRAVDLLSAPQLKGGEYTVVLDPVLAGVFVHEAFGHLSEADFVYENDRMRQIMVLGKEFGSGELDIVDSAMVPGLRGSYKYDDEGVPSTKTYLIREGKLVGRLHSRETAAKMNEAPTGNARAISYRHPPIVRMTNTFIEPKTASFEDIIADVKEGVYVKNWYGGTTSMEMFTFSGGEAYMIRNGKIAETLRPVVLTGNVFATLKNIDAIGNDLDMNQGGGCGKAGQMPLPVSNGSPHIRIQHCLIGGK